jgi:hypothetical protein
MEVNGQLCAATTRIPREEAHHPLERRLRDLKIWLEFCGEEKNPLPIPGIKL